jgi:RNA polymerase sigma-70 factor, ECF subfamily
VSFPAQRLRTPEERVGSLPNASRPPPPASRAVVGTQTAATSDPLLLQALRDRDEAAFEIAVDLYFSTMLRLALALVGERAIAEEVVQETWLAALEGIRRFEGRSSVKTWLFRILRNVALARARREDRTRPMAALGATAAGHAELDPMDLVVDGRTAAAGFGRAALWVQSSTPEEELLSKELAERVDMAISGLPPRQQEVLVLRDVEGWSAGDVCNALGISDTNQRVILHRARDRVRDELREYLNDDSSCNHDERDGVR